MRNLCATLAIILSIVVTPSIASTETPLKTNQQKLRYNVFAGGLHTLDAHLMIDLHPKDRYNIELKAKTYGLLGKLAPWEGKFESHGWNDDNIFKPEWHQSTAIWKKEEEIKRYSYKKDGSFNEYRITDDENDGSPREVDKKLTDQTSDVLTSTLNTLQMAAVNEKCEGTSDIFDGKRRYQLVFNPKKTVTLEKSRYNAYGGPALECTVEVKPVAGKWHEKPRGWMSIQEQGRERGTMPTIWLAEISEGQPAVPVKVRVKTAYGTLFMQMTDYETIEDDGTDKGVKKTLKLEK